MSCRVACLFGRGSLLLDSMNGSCAELRFVGGAIRSSPFLLFMVLSCGPEGRRIQRGTNEVVCHSLATVARCCELVFRSRLFYIWVTMCHRPDRAFLAVPCQPAPAALT
jgi:hypothetical protein